MEMPAVLENANLPSEESPKHQDFAENHGDPFCSEEGNGACTNENTKMENLTEDAMEISTPNDREEAEGTAQADGKTEEPNTEQSPKDQCFTESGQELTEELSSETSLPVSQNLETLPHRTLETPSIPNPVIEAKVDAQECSDQETKAQEAGVQGVDNGRNKHGPKRVTFPCDDDIVSGALEPKDPWRHGKLCVTKEYIEGELPENCCNINKPAQNVTVEDIVTSYTQACQKLNCKQIPKLIRQLQEIADLSGRVEILELKGEKLDYKACEALEEIFKRVQFKMVDLEQTNLDEDGASALFDMIEYYESATHLNISFNKHIGTRGWQAAAHMMRKGNPVQPKNSSMDYFQKDEPTTTSSVLLESLTWKLCATKELIEGLLPENCAYVNKPGTPRKPETNCLQYLDARNTPLLDHSAPFVARALRISSSLTVLHLENTSLSGRPLMLLATALKMNIVLRELYLADNRLNSLQDSAQLGNLLKFNGCIQILDLRNNHILDSGKLFATKDYVEGLLPENYGHIHKLGLAYICEGLKEQRQGLVTLVLWNNQLTHAGMVYMSMCLPHTQTLETLNLGHNAIGNEGVRHLKNGLIGNRSVLRLGLASAKLNCEGAVAVAEFVAESPRLLRLDLRENEIKTGGLMALSLALRVNQSLLRLDLDREPKKEAVKSFIETQKALLTEIQNGCRRNFVLAKEKEERLQQSASMAEIACAAEEEDSNPASEENNLHSDNTSNTPEDTRPKSSEQDDEEIIPTPDPQGQDSDSDTEEEVEEKPVAEVKPVAETKPVENSIARPPGQVAVSSPGRGHKIFLVTRVENSNTPEGIKTSQGNKAPSMVGVAAPQGPSLANGLETDMGRTTTCCDNKDSYGTYSDTEVEDLLRDASSEPDPSLNILTL